jgi:membrane peptidoglycan carboxypeptidase
MVRNRSITVAQAAQSYAETLQLTGPKPSVLVAPEFVQYVVDALTSRVGKDASMRGGLRVVTTLDLELQRQAELALKSTVAANSWRGVTTGALVAIDPRSGELLGTAFRVFTYTAAIASKHYTMVTPLPDAPITIDQPSGAVPASYKPMNFDGKFHGTCELQACLGNSLNPPAVQAELGIGTPEVVKMARALGAPPLQLHFESDGTATYRLDDPPETFSPALTLGGYGETALRMTTGMSALAGGGVLHEATAIRDVRRPTASPSRAPRRPDARLWTLGLRSSSARCSPTMSTGR